MSPLTGLAVPSSWPKLPNREQRMYHYPGFAPHQLLPPAQDPSVVCTRSLVLFDMPGQRNNSPFCTKGTVPGTGVVTARVMVDWEGPSEMAPPQISANL